MGYFEELVDLTLQEIVQPLDQLRPDSLSHSPFQTPIQSPPQSPPRIMAVNVAGNAPINPNANQPPPPPAWRTTTPLKMATPLHNLLAHPEK